MLPPILIVLAALIILEESDDFFSESKKHTDSPLMEEGKETKVESTETAKKTAKN